MWRNPKYFDSSSQQVDAMPPEKVAPQAPSGRNLITLPRTTKGVDEELRVSLDEYQGHPYLSVRLWLQDRQTKAWFPTKKGVSIRLREAQDVADALTAGLRIADRERPARQPKESPRELPRAEVGQVKGGAMFDEFNG